MVRNSVIVTGVGAIIGQGIVKSLRMYDPRIRVIGVDLNPNAFRAAQCDVFYPKPVDRSSEALISFFRDLLKQEAVSLILPGIEQDVAFFDETRREFAEFNAAIVLNRTEIIRISHDKWKTFVALQDHGLPAIPTKISGSWEECAAELGTPMLMKPRTGSGGRGQQRLETQRDFEYWSEKAASNFMVQRIVGRDDLEFTVGVFGYGDGEASAPAILKRTLGPIGCTWTAETVLSNPQIERHVRILTEAFRPLGPTNYQFRIESDEAWLNQSGAALLEQAVLVPSNARWISLTMGAAKAFWGWVVGWGRTI